MVCEDIHISYIYYIYIYNKGHVATKIDRRKMQQPDEWTGINSCIRLNDQFTRRYINYEKLYKLYSLIRSRTNDVSGCGM